MPGICGTLLSEPLVDASFLVAEMASALKTCEWHLVHRHVETSGRLALGQVRLGFVNQANGAVTSSDSRFVAILDGELYDVEQISAALRARGTNVDVENHTALFLASFQEFGESSLKEIQGAFAAAIWDRQQQQLHLINDRFGTRPIYLAQVPGRFVFASSIKSVMADRAVSKQPNVRGLAQFFSFGHYLLNDTSLEAVRLLPAASHVTINAMTLERRETRYIQLGSKRDCAPSSGPEMLERIDELFFKAVQRRVNGTKNLGLSLSGGLDARSILAVIDHQTVPLKTICMGQAGSLDHKSAEQLSALVGCEHHSFILGTEFLANFRRHLEDVVQLTDGQFISQCIVMATLPFYRELGIQVLLRGHAGELMHMHKAYSYSLDQQAMMIRNDEQLEDWMFSRLQGFLMEGVERPIFRGFLPDTMVELARASLREHIAEFQSLEPLQRIWPLFVQQRVRRETNLSMAKFRSIVEPRMPFLDNDLVDVLIDAQPELKTSEAIQTYILKKRMPSFLEITNSNTGAKVGASRLVQSASTFKLRVLAKLRVPGYQPYERLGLWLRREVAPIVQDVLLNEQSLDNGLFDADGVRQVVRDHLENRKNHTFLIMALMTYELGRKFLAN